MVLTDALSAAHDAHVINYRMSSSAGFTSAFQLCLSVHHPRGVQESGQWWGQPLDGCKKASVKKMDCMRMRVISI